MSRSWYVEDAVFQKFKKMQKMTVFHFSLQIFPIDLSGV